MSAPDDTAATDPVSVRLRAWVLLENWGVTTKTADGTTERRSWNFEGRLKHADLLADWAMEGLPKDEKVKPQDWRTAAETTP
jgi:hypothetical protein